MNERIRVGIVGAGFGVKAHLPALLAHPRFEVVALASPSSAARIAEERNIPQAFKSCADMVRNAGLEAVIVASPPFAHRDDVLAALEAHKHVLAEKPFALSVAEAEEMLEASRQAATICGVSHEFRWVPANQAIKELILNGHLDPLRNIEITQLTHTLRREGTRERSWWFERARGGGIGGALLSHVIDMSNWLANRPPKSSTGLLRTANPERKDEHGAFSSDVDDGAFALLDYTAGLVSRLSVDATTSVESFTLAAHAENRTAVASGQNITDTTLYSVDGEETAELQLKPSPYQRFASVQSNAPYLMELYDAFVAAIDEKPNPPGSATALPSFTEAVATQKVLATVGYGS